MPQQEPRKVDKIPEGYIKGAVVNGKQTYVLGKDKNPITEVDKNVSKSVAVKSSGARPPKKSSEKRTYKPKERIDMVYVDDSNSNITDSTITKPDTKEIGLYGGVDAYRNLLPKQTANQPYDVYVYPDAEGRYTNTSQKKYFIDGKEIDINKSLQGSNFVPSYIPNSNINEGENVAGVTRIMQPGDSGVDRTNALAENLLMAGQAPTKNTFGGSGFSKPTNTNNTFEVPKYDSKGNPITNTTVIGRKLAKGGVVGKVKGYAEGGTTKYNEFGTVNQNDIYSKERQDEADKSEDSNNKSANARAVANAAGQALGGLGTSYYNSRQPSSEGDATRSAAMSAIGQTGAIGGAVAGLAAIGDKIGERLKTRSEQVDPLTGQLKDEGMAKRNAGVGIFLSPSKRLSYKGGLTDVTGEKYVKSIEEKTKKQLDEIKEANTKAKLNQLVAANEARDLNVTTNEPYSLGGASFDKNHNLILGNNQQFDKNRPMYKKGGVVSKCYSDGGVIKGSGGPKEDKIKANVKDGSFVVPEENKELAEKIRAKYLKTPPKKKANLNQKEGTPVKLSNGEHLFTPEEKRELMAKGINVNMLAPEAENKENMNKEYIQFPNILGYKDGGIIKGTKVDGATWDGKNWVASDGSKYTSEKGKQFEDKYNAQQEKLARNEQTRKNSELNVYKRKLVEAKAANRTDEAKRLQDKINEISGVDNILVEPKIDKKTLSKSEMKPNSKISVPKSSKSKPVDSAKFKPTPTDVIEGDDVVVPVSPSELAKVKQEEDIKAAEANAFNKTLPQTIETASPQVKPVVKKSGLAGVLSNVDPTAFVGIGQTALGLNMLSKEKRPIDNIKIDPTYNANVDRATRDAQFGLTPEQKFLAEQDIQNALNDAKSVGLNYAGGNAMQAFNTNRAAINDAWKAKLGLKQADFETRMNKQMYADQQAANRANILASNRRTAFSDAMNAFQQKQQAGSELIGTGLANTIGAYRYNQELRNRDIANEERSSWTRNIGKK